MTDSSHGELPHADDILPTLYELTESDEPVKDTQLPAAAPPNQQASSGDWGALKKALTSSLASGTFPDSQFYVVESRSSTGVFPQYSGWQFCVQASNTQFPHSDHVRESY